MTEVERIDQKVTSKKEPLFTKNEWLLLITLCLVQFSHMVDFVIMMPLNPLLSKDMNISQQQFGVLVSSYTFAAGLSGILSAFFVDRFDRKKALMFFVVGFSIGTIACGLSPNYASLLSARTVTGYFGGVIGSLSMAIVGDSIPKDKRATGVGIVMSAFSLASILGVPLGLFLASQFNWHFPFVFLGVLSLGMLNLIWFVVPSMTSHLRNSNGNDSQNNFSILKQSFFKVFGLISKKTQVYGLLLMVFIVLGQFTIIPYLSVSLVANANFSQDLLAFAYLISGCVTLVTNFLVGRLADKFGRKTVFVFSAILSLFPIFLITRLQPIPTYFILLIFVSFFILIGGRMIPAQAIITGTVPPESRGAYMNLISAFINFSASFAAVVAGMIVYTDEKGFIRNYDIVGWIAICFSLVAVVFVSRMKAIEN